MPQTAERKSEYAKERRARIGAHLRAQNALWRAENRDALLTSNMKRRLAKRAMCLVAAARVRSRAKQIPFTLTAEDIAALQAVINAGKCELSGATFVLDGPRGPLSPSLDRIVPARGYVRGNVRVICHALNAALGDWGEDALRPIMEGWLRP
mgnify:CR=1 FL=1